MDWSPIESAPKDGTPFTARFELPLRWRAYKPDARRQGYPDGRWQVSNGYGGWANLGDMYPSEWKPMVQK